jgi:hypothetical protein
MLCPARLLAFLAAQAFGATGDSFGHSNEAAVKVGSAGVVVQPFSDVYFLGKPPYVRPAAGSTTFNLQPTLKACMRQCLRLDLCEFGTYIMAGAAHGQCWLASETYGKKDKCGVQCTSFWKTSERDIVGNSFLQRTVLHRPDDGPISNPERGFFTPIVGYASKFKPLNATTLIRAREDRSRTLVQRYFVLDKFIKTRISPEFLQFIADDFRSARRAGVKLILRFCYNAAANPQPPYDAPKSIVVKHLSQLETLLHENQDVISVVEQGFVGLWGEGTLSTHFGMGDNITSLNWQDRREVLTSLISMLPSGTFASVMAPWYKQKIFGPAPLNALLAFTEMFGARTGEHDNCFLGNADDLGTFHNKTAEYPYLSQESLYTPMGGRACMLSEPRSSCKTATRELGLFHYDYLDGVASSEVLSSWGFHKCLPEIKNSLGYRFALVESSFPQHVQHGGHFNFNIKFQNDGYSTPFHKRPVNLILRHRQQGQWCKAELDADIRTWHGRGKHFTLNYEVHIDDIRAQGFPDGEYEVLLHFPDRNASLASRPEYSIRLANEGSWETWSGFNKLMHTIEVSGTADGNVPASQGKSSVLLKCGKRAAKAPRILPEPMVSNPSFEQVDDLTTKAGVQRNASYWSGVNQGYSVVQGWGQHVEAHTGLASVFVAVPLQGGRTNQVASGVKQTFYLHGQYASKITVGGWSKATGLSTSGELPRESQYAVVADVRYEDGSTTTNSYAAFDRGSPYWQHSHSTGRLKAHKKIFSVTVRAVLKGVDDKYDDLKDVDGGAWFDDVTVALNGVTVQCPAGFYSMDNQRCLSCPAGFSCSTLAKVEKCHDRTFSMAGESICEPCPVCSQLTNRQGVCSAFTGQCMCTPSWSGFYCDYPVMNLTALPHHTANYHWKKCTHTSCAVQNHGKHGVRVVVKHKQSNGNQHRFKPLNSTKLHRCKRMRQTVPGSEECACECRDGGPFGGRGAPALVADNPWNL